MDVTVPPAGWHTDPMDSDGLRWWDGAVWTEHVRPRTPPQIQPVELVPVFAPPTVAPIVAATRIAQPFAAVERVHVEPTDATPQIEVAPLYVAPPYVPMSSYGTAVYRPPIEAEPEIGLTGRAKRVAHDRAVRRNNIYGYIGLALAFVALLFNVLAIPSLLAIIFSSIGLWRASELANSGVKVTGRGASMTGLALGVAALVIFGWRFISTLLLLMN